MNEWTEGIPLGASTGDPRSYSGKLGIPPTQTSGAYSFRTKLTKRGTHEPYLGPFLQSPPGIKEKQPQQLTLTAPRNSPKSCPQPIDRPGPRRRRRSLSVKDCSRLVRICPINISVGIHQKPYEWKASYDQDRMSMVLRVYPKLKV